MAKKDNELKDKGSLTEEKRTKTSKTAKKSSNNSPKNKSPKKNTNVKKDELKSKVKTSMTKEQYEEDLDKTIVIPYQDDDMKTIIIPVISQKINDVEKEEVNAVKNPVKKVVNRLNEIKYIGFNTRFMASLIIFIVLLTISFLLIMMSFSKVNEQTVDYTEKSTPDYKVFLKENTFYSDEYLGQGRAYVSTLINNIEATFMYSFDINQESNLAFESSVIAKLMIVDSENSKVFYDKEYTLSEKKQTLSKNSKNAKITEQVVINYDYYNNLSNEFRQTYGINSESYLEVTLKVRGTDLDNNFTIDNEYQRSIKIPLSQREVNIMIGDDKVSEVHKVISKNKLLLSNRLYIGIGIVSLILAILCLLKIINTIRQVLVPKKSKYDKYVGKILKEYDRLIVNTSSAPDLNELRIVKINAFEELLDVRDNLKLPIKYYVVTEHQKCIFYITHQNEIYLLTIKAVDLEQ